MLSEEKIVLIRLKETLNVLKGKNVIGRLDFQIRDMVEDCIRVIEKQSKEIEELNKSDASKEQSSMKYYNLYRELVDKIKAKIEEYEKNKKILEERKNGVFYSVEEIDKVDRNIKFYDVMINEMQSLLEKE